MDDYSCNDVSKLEKTLRRFDEMAYSTPKLELPKFEPVNFQKINEYQSASILMQALSEEALSWKKALPENYTPAILAILYGGIQINVHSISQISFHGIRVEGTFNGAPCSMLAHQSTIQILCFGQEITEEKPRRPIGFIWPDHNIEV